MTKLTFNPEIPHEWEIVGNVMVTITNTKGEKIPYEFWQPFIDQLVSTETKILLALVLGSATIDASQRKTAAEVFRGHNIKTIVLTDDRMARGVLTALSWLGADVTPLAWSEVEAALKHTGTSGEVRKALGVVANRAHGMR